jgi:hypothetical protein
MISYSLLAVFLSLFPFVTAYSGLDESTIWTISSSVMILVTTVHFIAAAALSRRILGADILRRVSRGDSSVLNPQFVLFLLFGSVLSVTVQSLNILGVVFGRSFTAYFIGLLWYLVASALFFVRLVMAGLREPDVSDA